MYHIQRVQFFNGSRDYWTCLADVKSFRADGFKQAMNKFRRAVGGNAGEYILTNDSAALATYSPDKTRRFRTVKGVLDNPAQKLGHTW